MDTNAGPEAGHKRTVPAIWIGELLQDIKLGWRRITRSPLFSAMTVVSLAIAIGGNTALFGLIEALILRAPPYAEPERLVAIRMVRPQNELSLLSYRVFAGLEAATKEVFEGMTGALTNGVHLRDETGRNDSPHNVLVAGPYFQVMGVEAQVGRVFDPAEGVEPGADPVVVLSDWYWREAFDGDPEIVGREVWLNGFPYTIVGVTEPGFHGVWKIRSAFWAFISMAEQLYIYGEDNLNRLEHQSLLVTGRLADGVTPADAATAVAEYTRHLQTTSPNVFRDQQLKVTPALAAIVHFELDRTFVPVATLAAGVLVLLLLLTCLNLASLLVVRTLGRRQELAVRVALGANRGRLVRSLFAETITLALLGGVAGVYLSGLLMDAIVTIELSRGWALAIDARMNVAVLLFALGATLLAGLLMGLGPTLLSAHPLVSEILKQERVGGPGGAAWARSALLVTQVAVTVMLIATASGFVRNWVIAHRVDPGFGDPPAVIVQMVPGPARPEAERRAFYDAYLERVTEIPGVVSAGVTTTMPLQVQKTSFVELSIPGVDPPPGHSGHRIDWAAVNGDFFDAIGIGLVAGRFFDSSDHAGSPRVAVVNEAMADSIWPGQVAVGQQVSPCDGCWIDVVGVIRDIKVRTLSESPRPFIYTHMAQSPYFHGTVVARTSGDPTNIIPTMLALGTDLDPEVFMSTPRTVEEHLARNFISARVSAVLLSGMGLFALVLAVSGIYGIVSYIVAARQRELVIRMSMGADPPRLLTWVLRSTMKGIAAGLAIGVVLAIVVTRALQETPFGVETFHSLDFVGSVILLAGAGVLAAYLSARRASRLNLVKALEGG